MGRRFRQSSKVTRIGHDPLAEMLLPNAIDNDSPSQLIIRIYHPVGQGQSSSAGVSVGQRDYAHRFQIENRWNTR